MKIDTVKKQKNILRNATTICRLRQTSVEIVGIKVLSIGNQIAMKNQNCVVSPRL